MTFLDMPGFSLTVVPASSADIAHLDAPCAPAAWPGCKSFDAPQTQPMPDGLALRTFKASTDEGDAQTLDLICKTFIAAEAELNTLDAKSGDRTMIDALEPALATLNDGLGAAAQTARIGADTTATISQAKAGRASYVGAAQLEGHRDPGAQAVALMFEALSR